MKKCPIYFFNVRAFKVTLLASAISLASIAADAGRHMSVAEADFVASAGQGNQAEVALGHLALKKAQAAAVRTFAQHIVRDHSKSEKQLEKIAHQSALAIPSGLSDEQSKLKSRLEGLSGAEFDKEYIAAMVEDHKKDIEEFSKIASTGYDPQLKHYVNQSLPTLKAHLKMAETVANEQTQRH